MLPTQVAEQGQRTSWGNKQQPPDEGDSNFSQTYLHNFGEAGEYITHTARCFLACGSYCPWGTHTFRMRPQTMVRWVGRRGMTGLPRKERVLFVGFFLVVLYFLTHIPCLWYKALHKLILTLLSQVYCSIRGLSDGSPDYWILLERHFTNQKHPNLHCVKLSSITVPYFYFIL